MPATYQSSLWVLAALFWVCITEAVVGHLAFGLMRQLSYDKMCKLHQELSASSL